MMVIDSMDDFKNRIPALKAEAENIKPKYAVGDKVITPAGLMVVVMNGSKSKIEGEWQVNYLCAFITSKGIENKRKRPITFQENQLTTTP